MGKSIEWIVNDFSTEANRPFYTHSSFSHVNRLIFLLFTRLPLSFAIFATLLVVGPNSLECSTTFGHLVVAKYMSSHHD